jgi:dTDP-4-amino-4,6-dideoxygalactose transaminase
MKKIQFCDLKKQYQQIKKEVKNVFKNVCENTAFSGGSFVDTFEKNLATYCQSKYAIGSNSGTSALHLALLALGIKNGDEVIVPANTFIASAWCVSYVNATPVFVDCTPNTWNIDPNEVIKKITPKTKAIIGVHLYGQPFDVDSIKKITQKHNLFLIEDCAQAIGAKYKNKIVGNFGEMGCFSFYPGKNLGAYGEGGGIITNNENYNKHIRSLRSHGSTTKYYHDEVGFNMRMDGIQGGILDIKLKYIDSWNQKRKQIAKKYQNSITNKKIKIQTQPKWSDSVYHLFVITVDNRNNFLEYMQKNNIFCGIHYPIPCHLQKAYSFLGYKEGDFPNAEYLANHCVSLPIYPELTDKEIAKVIKIVNKY